MKAEAIKYLTEEGQRSSLAIFPLNGKTPFKGSHGFKDATRDRAQVESWWTQYPSANIGIATGEINGLLVIDVDIKHDQGKYGDESLKALEQELGELPETWTAITGSGGLHYYFKYPVGHEISISASQLGEDLDIRANGGYVVAPPSVHPDTGRVYEWECGSDPAETPLAELPEKWVERLEKKKITGETLGESQKKLFEIPETVSVGARNDTLFRYGASLRAKSVQAIETYKLMDQFNIDKCSPPIPAGELQKIYDSVMKYQAGSSEDEIMKSRNHEITEEGEDLSQFHHFNDKGLPTSVYDFKIYEYLSQRGDIFILGSVPYMYRDGVFRGDVSGANLKTAIRKLIYPELVKSTTIERVYRLFLSEKALQVSYEDLNKYPQHWINFRNGFYDPIAQKMIPHDPKYRAINQIPHEYDPEAELTGEEVERWLQFIVPKMDDREMLLQFMGYCLTRDTRQQKFTILYGSGGSGKSTVIKLIELMIGSENISNISLKELSQRFASYGLLGKLLNSCADLEVSALEDTSVIKKVLGEDSLRGEPKGKDAISFKNYAKLIFSTNELPLVISEKTNGFYRRLMILNMTRQPEHKRADYLDLLSKEIDYLISLAVKALERMYQAGHITESAGSREAVQALRNDSDTVEAWIFETCYRVRESRIERGQLYQKYDSYCLSTDRTALSRNSFYRAMRAKDFREVKSNGLRYFEGISFEDPTLKKCPEWTEVTDQMELPFKDK